MNELIGHCCIIVGIFFDFFGCLGLIRFPDIYNRLQSSTKCVMFGTITILLGLLMIRGFSSTGIKALLCIGFIFLTAPVTAHALARAAHRSGIKLCEGSVCDHYQDDEQLK